MKYAKYYGHGSIDNLSLKNDSNIFYKVLVDSIVIIFAERLFVLI